MRKLSLFALIALTACGTPQEQCIRRDTRELRNLQSLLAQVEGNLARGYAYEEYDVPITRWEVCGHDRITRADGSEVARPRMCLEDDTITRTRQVAIDPAAEARKRDGLRARISALTPAAEKAVAACKAAYPETDQ